MIVMKMVMFSPPTDVEVRLLDLARKPVDIARRRRDALIEFIRGNAAIDVIAIAHRICQYKDAEAAAEYWPAIAHALRNFPGETQFMELSYVAYKLGVPAADIVGFIADCPLKCAHYARIGDVNGFARTIAADWNASAYGLFAAAMSHMWSIFTSIVGDTIARGAGTKADAIELLTNVEWREFYRLHTRTWERLYAKILASTFDDVDTIVRAVYNVGKFKEWIICGFIAGKRGPLGDDLFASVI